MSNVNRWIGRLAQWMGLGSPAVTDGRRRPRLAADLTAIVSGPMGTSRAKCVDLSRDGAAVYVSEAVEPGTLVFVRFPSLELMAFAYARHCREQGSSHRVGLEFRDGLRRERTVESGWDCRRVMPPMAWDEVEA